MKLKVLVLGNKGVNQRVINALTGYGVEVICWADTLEAIKQLAREKFDLALIDGNLAKIEQVCDQVSSLHHTPVAVVISGQTADWQKLHFLNIDGSYPG